MSIATKVADRNMKQVHRVRVRSYRELFFWADTADESMYTYMYSTTLPTDDSICEQRIKVHIIRRNNEKLPYPRCSHISGDSHSPSGCSIRRTNTVGRWIKSFPVLNNSKWPTYRIEPTKWWEDRLRNNKCRRIQRAFCYGTSTNRGRRGFS